MSFAFDANSYFWRRLREAGMPKWQNLTVLADPRPIGWDYISWGNRNEPHVHIALSLGASWWWSVTKVSDGIATWTRVATDLTPELLTLLRDLVEDPRRV